MVKGIAKETFDSQQNTIFLTIPAAAALGAQIGLVGMVVGFICTLLLSVFLYGDRRRRVFFAILEMTDDCGFKYVEALTKHYSHFPSYDVLKNQIMNARYETHIKELLSNTK